MQAWWVTLMILPAVGLLAAGLLPSSWANRWHVAFRGMVTGLAGGQCILAWCCGLRHLVTGKPEAIHAVWLRSPGNLPIAIDFYYDGVAALMLALVSFVGWVICKFSIRYLDGQATQGRYFRWTAFTLGAVSIMVVSGNLLMFFAAWVLTSLGLHQLLLHYADRPAAQRAAWTKFAISRLGDMMLIGALALTYNQFGTFDFTRIFAAITAQAEASPPGAALTGIGWLLVIGALTKSAQFPFHTWLPLTMETPTPVSALMHAGIVNAGGYLLIRTSPLVSQAPAALTLLALIGAITALLGALVMLTQTSIKRSLAYSTIAQMGFMMLQCGLGAFSAAMLHILAHSLYKAHAFLSSGGVIAQRTATDKVAVKPTSTGADWQSFALAVCVVSGAYATAMFSLGLSPAHKPGGFLLGFVLCLALVGWLWRLFSSRRGSVGIAGALTTMLLAWAYAGSYLIVDRIVTANPAAVHPDLSTWAVSIVAGLGFGFLFALQSLLVRRKVPAWLAGFYVHASNGFYLDAIMRRMFGGALSS